jgi:hypothetical protein
LEAFGEELVVFLGDSPKPEQPLIHLSVGFPQSSVGLIKQHEENRILFEIPLIPSLSLPNLRAKEIEFLKDMKVPFSK